MEMKRCTSLNPQANLQFTDPDFTADDGVICMYLSLKDVQFMKTNVLNVLCSFKAKSRKCHNFLI